MRWPVRALSSMPVFTYYMAGTDSGLRDRGTALPRVVMLPSSAAGYTSADKPYFLKAITQLTARTKNSVHSCDQSELFCLSEVLFISGPDDPWFWFARSFSDLKDSVSMFVMPEPFRPQPGTVLDKHFLDDTDP